VGVYATDKNGKEKLIYFKKHKVTSSKMKISIKVAQKPSKAGIDPLNILMDKNSENNVITINAN